MLPFRRSPENDQQLPSDFIQIDNLRYDET